ncbi:hypothetical protein OAA43_00115 [bacterium]|nr:hypothetical protein [bacterium]
MIDTDKYEGHTPAPWDVREAGINRIMVYTDDEGFAYEEANRNLVEDAPLLLAELKRLREDYENMSEVLRENGMDICRHCRVIYRDDDMNHPHYPSLHPWHMDGMCMKEMKE